MITAYIEIPGYAPEEVTIESVRLVTTNGYVWATETPSMWATMTAMVFQI